MTDQDMKQANQSYAGFVNLLKWGSIATFAVTALVVILISN